MNLAHIINISPILPEARCELNNIRFANFGFQFVSSENVSCGQHNFAIARYNFDDTYPVHCTNNSQFQLEYKVICRK